MSAASRVMAHTGFEIRLTARNGEQLLLTLIIPVVLLVALASTSLVTLGRGRAIDTATPGILALAVMSTAFTGQAIATGFERRYGALRSLGATPLGRGGLLAGKTLAVLIVEVAQVSVIAATAFLLGWSPAPASALPCVVLLLVGTVAFSALGLLMAGTLRAEAVLAGANAVYLLLLLGGGIVVPVSQLPPWWATIATALPSGALGEGLRDVLRDGQSMPWSAAAVLTGWALAAGLAAARTFRWE